METILANVATLSEDPKAWVIAGLVVLKALHSFFLRFRCPVMRGTIEVTETMVADAKAYKFRPPPSFLFIMLGGVALAVIGLYLLNDTQFGPLALIALVVGVFMFITEPTRLFVNASKMEVFATTASQDDANALARDRLRSAHMERALYEAIIAAAVVGMLWFF